MNQLEQYVYDQLNKGYTADQIRSFLVSRGYEQKQVESAIINSKNNFVEKQLINYVSSTLKQGYAPQQIHDQLLTQGYKEKNVDVAFNDVNKNHYGGKLNVVHQHTVSNNSIIKMGAMLLVVALLVGGGFFSFQYFTGQDDVKLLDLSSEAVAMTIKPGDQLKFRLTMLNQGDPGRVDIYLTYTIETVGGNRVIRSQETKAFETTIRDVVSVQLPPDIPDGTYIAKVEADYKEQHALSSFTFYVLEEGTKPEEPITENPNTEFPLIDETDNTLEDDVGIDEQEESETEIKKPKPRDPPKIKTVKTTEENDDNIFTKAVVETNFETAAGYCQQIKETILRDECFVYVATSSNEVNYCDLVSDISRKEDCKIGFVLDGNADICLEMTLDENKQLCSQFTQMNALKQYGEDGDLDTLMGDLHVQPIPPQTPSEAKPHESIDDLDIADVVHQ